LIVKKITKLSHNEKAAARAAALLKAGVTLTVPAFRGYYTAGAYTPAVGPGGFAVYGYSGAEQPAREFTGRDALESAAFALVHSCGSTRLREACIAAERKRARQGAIAC